jgi:hypothetical protein
MFTKYAGAAAMYFVSFCREKKIERLKTTYVHLFTQKNILDG